jgi:2-polyprenyl-3-methyl-5-hydroxy-6-metoxy-1,4-benzoquinol methylase
VAYISRVRSLTEFEASVNAEPYENIRPTHQASASAQAARVSQLAMIDAAAYSIEDQWRMSQARNYFAWQACLVRRELGQRIVEVGSGVGNFTEMLLDRQAVCAVDVEPRCIEQLLARYAGRKNLSAIACDVESEEFSGLGNFGADSCLCLNVLEHVADDLGALKRMASVLRPNGVIVLLVPAFQSLYGPIDRNLGHYRRYRRDSLIRLAAASALEIRKLRYMNVIGFFAWWTNSHIFRREVQSAAQIEFFDRCVVPAASWIENRVAPPFGQSLLTVLQKP